MSSNLGAVAALVAVIAAGTAHGATVTISFDELGRLDYEPTGGQVGNVAYEDLNRYSYGNISPALVLGDDGFVPFTAFRAAFDTYFTPLSVDLEGRSNVEAAPCFGCTPEEAFELQDNCSFYRICDGFRPYGFANVRIAGYRDGRLVATDFVGGPDALYSGAYAFSSAFAGIDGLIVELLRLPREPASGYVFACGEAFEIGCVSGSVDNLTVRTFQPSGAIATAPVPTALGSLLLALGALGALHRRRAARWLGGPERPWRGPSRMATSPPRAAA